MKKLFFASLVITAMVTFTLGAVKNKSSLPENPLLTANVEALSQGESLGCGIFDIGGGSILVMHAENAVRKGRRLNYCLESSPSSTCVVAVGCTSNGFPNIAYLLQKIVDKLDFSALLDWIKSKFA